MGSKEPPAGYRELGAAMRKLRTAAGMTGLQITHKTGWDLSQISRIESGQVQIDLAKLVWYLGILRVPHEVAVPLINLCHQVRMDKGYWLNPRKRAALSSLMYHESNAKGSVSFGSDFVPGLLQTERYARTIMSKKRENLVSIDDDVALRMERQKLLQRHGLRQRFLIHEHVLRLPVGGSEVMGEQMLALTLAGALPNVEVRVVPVSAGADSVCGGAFRVFDFEAFQPLVMLGTLTADFWLEEMSLVRPYRELIPDLDEVALSEDESREMIAELADEYDKASANAHADKSPEARVS